MSNPLLTHFPIRGGPLAQTLDILPIHSHVRLHGVGGFALHQSHKQSTAAKWVVSHIETGAECGTGKTQGAAIRDAEFKSRDRAGVYAGIERTKEQLALLGVEL